MFFYIFKRVVQVPFVLLIICTLSFFLMRFTPGGPFSSERNLDPVVEKALKAKFNLDQPMIYQYGDFILDLAKGDLGPSFKHKARSVNEIIAATLPNSIILGVLALSLALLIGVSSGIISALKQSSLLDYSFMGISMLGLSIPTFVIAPLLQITFSIYYEWFPLAGFEGFSQPSMLVLPTITLALPFAARIARLMRSGMLEVIHQDFIRTAHAKGLSSKRIVFVHALRGGILPVVSFLGPAMASLLTGSLVVEKIFQIPGLGREFVEGALNRDYTLVMGTVIVYGVILISLNLIADILYAILDPRVRLNH